MASWKKVLVSGSSIEVNQITASGVPTLDNENNLLAISTDGAITQITQGNVAGTNPTFTIAANSSSLITSNSFSTGTDYLIFSHSLDHGFYFTVTGSNTTSSVNLTTPQDLRTSAGPTFASITASNGIAHANDTHTRIEFVDDQILFHAGGVKLLSLVEGGTNNVVINQDSADVDFRVEGNEDDHLLFVDGGNDKVAIGTSTVNANSLLTVDGTIHTAGITASALPTNTTSTTVIIDGGSGVFEKRDVTDIINTITGSLTASIIGTANEIGVTTDSGGNIVIGLTDDVIIPSDLTVTDNLDLTGGDITVHGHISASGNITASGNLQVGGDIALGGNLFSFTGFSFIEGVSANFSGSNVFGSGSSPADNDITGGGTAHQFTGSVGITGSALTITDGNLSLDNGSITATNGSITANNGTGSFGYLTATEISSSGNLFAELPNDTSLIGDGVVVYDTATGKLLYTGSSAVGVTSYPDLSDIPSGIVSGSTISSTGQGQITHTVNDNSSTTNITDLLTTGNPTFASLKTTGNITASGDLTVSGQISGSSHLFASLSLNSNTLSTVMYDTNTGKFFHTGSYGGGGGGEVAFSDITSIPTLISSSTFSSNNQGGITASINGVSSSFDVGLTVGDSPTFNGLNITNNTTIGGNLTVNGTMTTISTTDLEIEDKFILLASGSATDVSSGIVVERATGGVGTALFWNTTTKMWSIDQTGYDSNAVGAVPDADVNLVTVKLESGIPSSSPLSGEPAGANANYPKGQIAVDTTDEYGVYIWI